MPFYIDESLVVLETEEGRAQPWKSWRVAPELVDQLPPGLLHRGVKLTVDESQALLDSDAARFIELVSSVDREGGPIDSDEVVPPAGRWRYKVVNVSEMAGFATAAGTAARMEEVLNLLAADGWELVESTARDSRWLAGETVLLTFKQYIVTRGTLRAHRAAMAAAESQPAG